MEYFDLIEKRYSVRKFTQEEVKKEDLEKMIKAAGIAPSGKNRQDWHFVIVRNKEIIKKMGETVKTRVQTVAERLPKEEADNFIKFNRFSSFFEDAPVVVCVYAKDYIPEGFDEMTAAGDDKSNIDRLFFAKPGIQGVGAAIENLILAAFDLGYGACWMTNPNNSAIMLEDLLGYKDEESKKLLAIVPIGVPAGEKRSPKKKELSEIATWID